MLQLHTYSHFRYWYKTLSLTTIITWHKYFFTSFTTLLKLKVQSEDLPLELIDVESQISHLKSFIHLNSSISRYQLFFLCPCILHVPKIYSPCLPFNFMCTFKLWMITSQCCNAVRSWSAVVHYHYILWKFPLFPPSVFAHRDPSVFLIWSI